MCVMQRSYDHCNAYTVRQWETASQQTDRVHDAGAVAELGTIVP